MKTDKKRLKKTWFSFENIPFLFTRIVRTEVNVFRFSLILIWKITVNIVEDEMVNIIKIIKRVGRREKEIKRKKILIIYNLFKMGKQSTASENKMILCNRNKKSSKRWKYKHIFQINIIFYYYALSDFTFNCLLVCHLYQFSVNCAFIFWNFLYCGSFVSVNSLDIWGIVWAVSNWFDLNECECVWPIFVLFCAILIIFPYFDSEICGWTVESS